MLLLKAHQEGVKHFRIEKISRFSVASSYLVHHFYKSHPSPPFIESLTAIHPI